MNPESNIMKPTKKFLLVGALAAMVAVPSIRAEEPAVEPSPAVEEPAAEEPVVEEPVAEEPAVEEPAVEEPAIEEPAVEEPVVDESGGGGVTDPVDVEVTVCEAEPMEGAICEMVGGEHLRDKDGGLDPDVILQNTAVDGGAEEPVDKTSAFGQDERGADIQSKAAGQTAVKREKKGPVALIKKGRVFLR